MCLVCGLFSLPLVPVPPMFHREHHRAKGGCEVPRMRENAHKMIEKQHIPKGVVKG